MRPTRREISERVRAMITEIRDELENLTYEPTTLTHARGSSGTVIRTKSGALIGQVTDTTAAAMIVHAPRWLKIMAGYVEQFESEAYARRLERRRFRRIENALYEAEGAGIGTTAGRRHIEDALEWLRRRDDEE